MNKQKSPVLVLRQNTKRETGRKAQFANIQAGKTISDIVRTTLGPKSMLKMLLDPMGGIVMTNDGNAILRELDVMHPAAKSIIELSRSQDEEVGDGTTSVVVLAGEILALSEPFLSDNMHPTIIVTGYMKALQDALSIMEGFSTTLDVNNPLALHPVISSCLDTKFSNRWGEIITQLAVEAAKIVTVELPNGKLDIDIKRYAKVEKIPGGEISDSCILTGVMLNKDVTHANMRRYIENPKILLLDCTLEYKKGESQLNVEITKEEDWTKLLEQEEIEVQKMCESIIKTGCNVVVTEKGVSDLAQHFLLKAGISVIRRARKSDNNRIARASGATIVNRTEEAASLDVGLDCGLFEVKLIGDEYFSFFTKCNKPKACTIMLRGSSKDVLNEVERNLADAMNIARNILMKPKLLPGGGATEMELSARLIEKSKGIKGTHQWPYKAIATALEIIPRTLAQNSGANVVKTMTDLRSRHSKPGQGTSMGIDGNTGHVVDVTELAIWDTFAVKEQILKTAIESASMLLRIDDVLSGITNKEKANSGEPSVEAVPPEQFGDSRDG